MLIMPTIFKRIFLIYSFLLYLVPKKLRPFFPSPAAVNPKPAAALLLRPPSLRRRSNRGGGAAAVAMDQTEFRRVFQMFDRNGDGTISKKELYDSLESLGIFIPDKELEEMIHRIDDNGDGSVDMDEFEALYRSIMADRDEEGEKDMMEAFNVFDQNGDGFITVDELRSVLASLGLKQGRTMEDCRKMITTVDVDGDGRVNYKEFKQMMKGGGFSALSS